MSNETTIKDALRTKLISSSDSYEKLQNELLVTNLQQESAQNRLRRQELQIEVSVSNETTQDGKKKHTNQSMRDAACQKVKDSNELYKQYDKENIKISTQIKTILMGIEILKFQQRNNLKLVEIELNRRIEQ